MDPSLRPVDGIRRPVLQQETMAPLAVATKDDRTSDLQLHSTLGARRAKRKHAKTARHANAPLNQALAPIEWPHPAIQASRGSISTPARLDIGRSGTGPERAARTGKERRRRAAGSGGRRAGPSSALAQWLQNWDLHRVSKNIK
jgi:hypothetical protein